MTGELLVVEGGLVLAPDLSAHKRDIVVNGGVIVDVAPTGGGPIDARRVDAADRAVIPGLVNAHVHGHGNLAKGLVEDRWPLELFLNALPGLSGSQTEHDKYLNGLLGAVEMIRKGCTAACDLFAEFPAPTLDGITAVAQAYADVGVRAVVAPMVADRTFYRAYPALLEEMPLDLRNEALSLVMGEGSLILDRVEAIASNWRFDHDRIRLGVAPSIPLHCSDAFLTRCAEIAKKHGLVLHTHLAESKVQAVTGQGRYGATVTAHLDRLGLLGPNFSAVHAIWLDDDDMRRLADRGSSAVHAPGSNLRFGSGLAQIRRMMDHGVNVALATDAANTSDHLNMFEAMRFGVSISTVLSADHRRWLGKADAFGMATAGGAKALGFEGRLGQIAPGFKADLVFLDLGHINYTPLGDLAHQIVFGENGAAVDSVMVDGRLVMDRGRMTTVDEAKLRCEANAAAERLREANAASRERSRRLAPAVAALCRSFACRPYHVHRLACDPLPSSA
jgi:5-methylthioadenosine/S-adenosylhomocysteine deaminase